MTIPGAQTPTLAAVRAAREAQDAAEDTLRASLDGRQQVLLDELMAAVLERSMRAQDYLVDQLAELVAGLGPTMATIITAMDDGPELFRRR